MPTSKRWSQRFWPTWGVSAGSFARPSRVSFVRATPSKLTPIFSPSASPPASPSPTPSSSLGYWSRSRTARAIAHRLTPIWITNERRRPGRFFVRVWPSTRRASTWWGRTKAALDDHHARVGHGVLQPLVLRHLEALLDLPERAVRTTESALVAAYARNRLRDQLRTIARHVTARYAVLGLSKEQRARLLALTSTEQALTTAFARLDAATELEPTLAAVAETLSRLSHESTFSESQARLLLRVRERLMDERLPEKSVRCSLVASIEEHLSKRDSNGLTDPRFAPRSPGPCDPHKDDGALERAHPKLAANFTPLTATGHRARCPRAASTAAGSAVADR